MARGGCSVVSEGWPAMAQADALAPFLERHGVANALGRETATVHNWWADSRSSR